jgi:hypothetical protein
MKLRDISKTAIGLVAGLSALLGLTSYIDYQTQNQRSLTLAEVESFYNSIPFSETRRAFQRVDANHDGILQREELFKLSRLYNFVPKK